MPTHIHVPSWSPFTQYSYLFVCLIIIYWLNEKSGFTLLKLCQNWSLMSHGVIFDVLLFQNKVNDDNFVLILFIVFVCYVSIAIFLQLTLKISYHMNNFSICSITTNNLWCPIWTSRSWTWSTAGSWYFPYSWVVGAIII